MASGSDQDAHAWSLAWLTAFTRSVIKLFEYSVFEDWIICKRWTCNVGSVHLAVALGFELKRSEWTVVCIFEPDRETMKLLDRPKAGGDAGAGRRGLDR